MKRWKVGDEVVIHCNQDDGDDEECNGGDPMFSPSQRIWGYETPDGSFAQFCRVQDRQLLERPKHLTWEESACYTLVLATAYRMLFGHRPHVLRPGHNVLVWGASGGLGSMAVQLCATSGANAIGVVSDDDKRDFVHAARGQGRDQPQEVQLLGPDAEGRHARIRTPGSRKRASSARRSGRSPAKATMSTSSSSILVNRRFPVSVLVVKRGGMVVICAGTTGYNLTMDARYLWMHQKRVQGSHFANLMQARQANNLVVERRIDPACRKSSPGSRSRRRTCACSGTSTSRATWRCWSRRRRPASNARGRRSRRVSSRR